MHLKIALDLYDRHLPFFLGTVTLPKGITVEAMEVGMVPPRRHGIRRHARMLHEQEFDFCELSLVSYIMAKAAGSPLSAIPVFPRRLFSQNHIWVKSTSGLAHPRDLRGKRVLVWAFQVTMSVLAKGDLRREYGVGWREINWVAQYPEEWTWEPPAGVKIERAEPEKSVLAMFRDGDIDAYINPHPPVDLLEADGEFRRLFANPETECAGYFKRNGFMPIMHLIGVHPRVVDNRPELLMDVMRMWEEAREISRDYYTDPNFSQIAFSRNLLDRQRSDLAGDVWLSGFRENRPNILRFIDDCLDQTLIHRELRPEELFHPLTLET